MFGRSFRGTLLLSIGVASALLIAACSKADNTDAALANEPTPSAGNAAKGGGTGKGGSAGVAGSEGDAGEGGTDAGGKGGTGTGGKGGSAGKGGSGGKAGSTGKAGTGGKGGNAGKGGAAGDGDAGEGGSEAGGGGGSDGGEGGSSAGEAGASGADAGTGGSGGVPGWTCGPSLYDEQAKGEKYPQCNCECGVVDPDCANPFSYMKGCDKGQTCSPEGKCQGEVAKVPAGWTCGSAYYAIGGRIPVCDCACGAPDPDCDLPRFSSNLLDCGKGQTCGADGKCAGPILTLPAEWTKCDPKKWAEGKTSGTCDCDCGAPDPDCDDPYLPMTGCGYKQTCNQGVCEGAIAPAPAGWDCASEKYSDGKICNCACGSVGDPDCDFLFDKLPDDCGEGSFCLTNKNECF